MPVGDADLTIYGRFIDDITSPISKAAGALKAFAYVGSQVDETTGKLIPKMVSFKASLLSIMFFGMQLQRTFGFLNKAIRETYFETALLEFQFGLLDALAPILEPLEGILFGILDAFQSLPEPVQTAISALLVGVGVIGTFLAWLGMIGLAIPGLLDLGLTIKGISAALFGASGAASTASSGIIAAVTALGLPFLAWLAVVLGVIDVLITNWNGVRDFFIREFWEDGLKPIFDQVGEAFKIIADSVINVVMPPLKTFRTFIDLVGAVFLSVISAIAAGLRIAWDVTIGPILQLFIGFLEGLGLNTEEFADMWERVWGNVGAFLESVWTDTLQPMFQGLLDFLQDIAETLEKVFLPAAREAGRWIGEKLGGFLGLGGGGGGGGAGAEAVPLQEGGLITRGGLARVHAGETVVPAGVTTGPVNINIYGPTSGEEVFEAFASRMRLEGRRLGL